MSETPEPPAAYADLSPGDPAPWFHQRTSRNPRYAFDMVAGRYVVLCFHATAGDATGRATIDGVLANRHLFDDDRACFFGVSLDPADEAEARVGDSLPGIRFFWDFDGSVSRLYGAIPRDCAGDPVAAPTRRLWVVLDPTLRVLHVALFSADGGDAASVLAFLERLPPPERFAGIELQAPILLLPNVLEPALCAALIDLHRRHGGEDSGFMREVDGRTVRLLDHGHKRRRDHAIEDPDIVRVLDQRLARRVFPEILKIHSFRVTQIERHIVGCYAAEDGGHFRAHRDNSTKATAHRRFAVSINLNAEFDGGDVSFPEYGPRRFSPPVGGALVFSCNLLHTVSPVTRGRRYAFLPFLYDDEAIRLSRRW
jgi:predicted 2-oxoglutarate/Fe(II)-dependent dioxygenase YbiX/peroxiredoxin